MSRFTPVGCVAVRPIANLVFAVSLMSPLPVLAQEADDMDAYATIPLDEEALPVAQSPSGTQGDATQLETMSVVATRTARALDQIPQSVTVLQSEDMALLKARISATC